MIGVGRLIRLEDTDHAEVTFTIADEFQGMGLGRLLLDRLAAAAPAIGVYVFEADVLTTNTAMLHVFATSGYAPSITPEGYLQHVVLRVDRRASALARISRREHRAARRSLEKLLAPRAVAVIGANRQPGTIGHEILVNLIAHGFPGPVYPVNPAAADIAGRPAVARVQDLTQPVDLAIIAVPPTALADVIRDCAEAGVGAVVVVTADYPGEADTWHAAERDITRFVRSHGMRMVGPTSMGLLSAHAGSVLHATFAPVRPPAGPVAMSSQSGPLGLAILDLAHRAGLGFSCFVSIGAAADVSSNDLLEWWEDDPETGVVLLYLESFGNPRNFGRIARRVGARKPVVAVTPGGAVASGALLAQAGVIHTTSLEEMFDVAMVLANQPVPPGSRVAIVTNAIDPAKLTVAACAASGLTMATLSEPTLDRLLAAGIAPPLQARAPGVVDLRPTAAPGDYLTALSAVLADPEVDSAIVIFMPPLVRAVAEVAAAIKQAAGDASGKPVVASFMSESGLPALLRDDHGAIPSYVFPERAAAALGRAAAYGRWRREPVGVLVYPPGIDQKAARELIAAADTGWLAPADAAALLGHYGVRVADAVPPTDQGTGGTDTPWRNEETRRGVLRVHQDSLVGPVISFGLAGLFSDLFGDVTTGVTPLTDRDASALLASLRAYPLLTGAAGGSPADLPAIEETMLRLSALAEDWPAVAEVTIDTLLLGGPEEGVTAVTPAVRIAPVDDGGSDRLNGINRSIIYVIDPRETACPAPQSGRSGDSGCPAQTPVPPARRGRRSWRSTAAATAPTTGIIRWIPPRRCSPWGRRWDTGSSRSTGPDMAPRTASSGTACGRTARRRSFSTSSTRSGPAAIPAPPSSLSAIPWAPCSPCTWPRPRVPGRSPRWTYRDCPSSSTRRWPTNSSWPAWISCPTTAGHSGASCSTGPTGPSTRA
jgi:acyl-CoA synthetase (NDP forming)